MKGKGLGRLYDRLTPEERFRLDVEATARGDREESERLTRTCPRRTYVMNEWGFAGRWQHAADLTVRVYVHIAGILERLRMLEAFRTLPPYADRLARSVAEEAYFDGHRAGSYHAWNAAGKRGNPPAWPGADEDLHDEEEDPVIERDLKELDARVEKYGGLIPQILDRMERTVAAEALTCWEGYAAFCADQLGLEAEKVVTAAMTEEEASRVAAMRATAERLGVEPDHRRVEELRAGLAEGWGKVLAKEGQLGA